MLLKRLTYILLLTNLLWAQQPDTSRSLPVHGGVSLSTQHSTNPGNDYLLQPPDYFRLRGDLSLQFLGLPITAGGLYTTEQGPYRQAISQFSIGLDERALQSMLQQKVLGQQKTAELDLKMLDELEKKGGNLDKKLFDSYPDLGKYQQELAMGQRPMPKVPGMQGKADSLNDKLQKNLKRQRELQQKMDSINRVAKTAAQLGNAQHYRDSLALLEQQARSHTLEINEMTDKVPDVSKYKQWKGLPADSLQHRRQQAEDRLAKLKQLQKTHDLPGKTRMLDSLGMLSKKEQKLLTIQKLKIGTSYPYYSDLFFNGASVLGADVEVSPGRWHLQLSAAHNQNASQAIDLSNVNSLYRLRLPALYTRNIVAASVGTGLQNKAHVHFNVLYGSDRRGQEPDTLFPDNNPRRNYLLGADFAVPLLEESLTLEGELNKSLIQRDLTQYDPGSEDVARWMGRLYAYNDSLANDYAARIGLKFRLDQKYDIAAGYRYIGPGYTSFGVPFLRNDLQAYKVQASRTYDSLRLTLRGSAEYEQTNLRGLKPYGMNTTYLGGGATWNGKKGPTISADYQAALQRGSDTDSLGTSGNFHLFSLTLSHSYGKKTPQTIVVNGSRQLRTAQQTFYNPEAPAFPTISLYTGTLVYRLQRGKLLYTTQANVVWESATRTLSTDTTADYILPPQRIYALNVAIASRHLSAVTIQLAGALAHDEFQGTRLMPNLTLTTTLLKTLLLEGTAAYNRLTRTGQPTEYYWQFNSTIGYRF